MTDIIERLRAHGHCLSLCNCDDAGERCMILQTIDEIERLTAERNERSAEIARLLMKIDRLRKDKLAWQEVAVGYGDAIGKLAQILPPD